MISPKALKMVQSSLNLSIREISDIMKVSESTILNYRAGNNPIPLRRWDRINQFLVESHYN